MEKTALIVEGGAMRGVFSCGILDSFLQHSFTPFDLCIGVSAGANNLSGYISGMYQRNYKIYIDYSLRKEFISKRRFLLGGDLLNLDWLWDITLREMPLDEAMVMQHPSAYLIGITRADTGIVEFHSSNGSNLAQLLKASSAVPLLYRNTVRLNGFEYVDGGIGEPIPVQEAVQRGATNIMVLRSRPADFRMETGKKHRITAAALRRYPRLVEVIKRRADRYNATIDYIRNPPAGISITEINPPDGFAIGRLTTDKSVLDQNYADGRQVGDRIVREWQG
ncbi:MAG: patatin-like phospholipase family protein [Spirochaeta sp.]